MSSTNRKIGIVGSGLIGRSFAMLFAGGNYNVYIYDIKSKQIENALSDIKRQLQTLEKNGMLRGTLNSEQQYALIKGTTSLKEAIQNAILVQECVPEVLELKRKVWKQMDEVATPHTILSSSSSGLMPSLFTEHIKNRCREAYSISTEYLVLSGLRPSHGTNTSAMDRPGIVCKTTRAIMKDIGQTPVNLSKEVVGFAVNRIQYALVNEVFNLVTEGILDVADMEKVMTEGLGMRYAFLGPLETTHLNAEGFVNYCERYADVMHSVSKDFKPPPRYEGAKVKEIEKQLEALVPLEAIPKKREWRDLCLSKIGLLKKEMEKEK